MTRRKGISKWQHKSTRVNQIRWELEELLNNDFTPEEKQSQKYCELVESIHSIYKYAVPELKKQQNRNIWKMTLLISLATSGGAIVIKLIDFLIALLTRTPPGGVL